MARFSGLALSVLLTTSPWAGSALAEAVDPPVHECDRLAASPLDTHAVVSPVSEVDFDADEAAQACEAALSKFPDVPRFQAQLGRALYEADRKEEAAEWLRKAAEQDYAYAMAFLGTMYANGEGVSKDDAAAAKWFQRAAEQGNAYAQAWLGTMYAYGRGVPQDYDKAANLLRPAAEQRNPTAQKWLGWFYENGRGVTQDHAEARKWYQKAAAQGVAEAQTALERLDSTFSSPDHHWMADARTGCRVAYTSDKPDDILYWTGECKDGKATGTGRVVIHRSDGIAYWEEDITETNGLILRDGLYYTTEAFERAVSELRISECNGFVPSYRVIEANVDANIDLANNFIVNRFLSRAEKIVWEKCPVQDSYTNTPDLTNIVVQLHQNGKNVVRARSYPGADGKPSWREFQNDAWSEKRTRMEDAYRQAVTARQQEQLRLQEAERRRQEDAQKLATLNRFKAFQAETGAEQLIEAGTLVVNPFSQEGRIVAVHTRFDSMIARDRALFSLGMGEILIVSNVPANLFQSRVEVILAGRVQGNELVRLPLLGDTYLPHLEFVHAWPCQQRGCYEMLAWRG